MTYLLDTCVISEAMKKRPDPDVMEWMRSVDEELMFISAVSIGEIRKGIAALGKTRRATFLLKWLVALEERYANRILAYNLTVAETWGDAVALAERNGHSRLVLDSLIAATARTDNMTLVTRNVADMEYMGVRILNPWKQ
jgi:predicted nucleic acid-binding protein